MSRTLHPRGRLASVLLGSLLALSLLAGCFGADDDASLAPGGDDPENAGANGASPDDPLPASGENGNGNGDEPAIPEEPACTPSQKNLYTWTFDGPAVPDPAGFDPESDPTMILGEAGSAEFTVTEGTTSLAFQAAAGDFITLGFSVAVLDPSGSDRFSLEGAAGPSLEGVTGEPIIETGFVSNPAPGVWTVEWSLTGYIEGLQLDVDAELCT